MRIKPAAVVFQFRPLEALMAGSGGTIVGSWLVPPRAPVGHHITPLLPTPEWLVSPNCAASMNAVGA